MTKTKAGAVIRAAEKVRTTERRVVFARRNLAQAERALDRAEGIYLGLVSETMRSRLGPGPEGLPPAAA